MSVWIEFLGYQAVWFAAVIAAGHGHWWPGALAAALFVAIQLAVAPRRSALLRLLAAALLAGAIVDGALALSGLARYAAAWPSPQFAPLWILGLWCAFATTLLRSLRPLRHRPALAALLGLIGAPLAYSGAARGFGAVAFAEPAWHGLLALALGWAAALPWLARVGRDGARGACVAASGAGA
ncbi:DUF2878 domain-containing protein [Lysobacter enzymogenes]|uniref:DUF2878 domain-containing protein n=1 Tax=Lysobacter enzymogenes TaxID=69 RepID=UPI00384B2636